MLIVYILLKKIFINLFVILIEKCNIICLSFWLIYIIVFKKDLECFNVYCESCLVVFFLVIKDGEVWRFC